MVNQLEVIQKNNKFIVTKNGNPIVPTDGDRQSIVTEFATKEDAEKYVSILANLSKQKRHQKS